MSGLLTLYTNQPWLVLLSPTRGSLLDSDAPETPNPQIEWFSLWSVRSSPDPAPRQPPQTDCLDFVLCILFSYTSLFLLLKGCVLAKISFSFVTFSHSNFNLCSLWRSAHAAHFQPKLQFVYFSCECLQHGETFCWSRIQLIRVELPYNLTLC